MYFKGNSSSYEVMDWSLFLKTSFTENNDKFIIMWFNDDASG